MLRRKTLWLKYFFTKLETQYVKAQLMATLDDVQTHLQAVADGVQNLKNQIQTLRDQLASGSPVTQEQLDALDAKLQEIASSEQA